MKDSVSKINESINAINAVLENHKEVITQLCTKCGIELDNNDNNDIDEAAEQSSATQAESKDSTNNKVSEDNSN
jgi:hypothetical protein